MIFRTINFQECPCCTCSCWNIHRVDAGMLLIEATVQRMDRTKTIMTSTCLTNEEQHGGVVVIKIRFNKLDEEQLQGITAKSKGAKLF